MACMHACQAECLFVNDGTLAHANTQREAISNGAMFVRQIYTNAFDLIRRVSHEYRFLDYHSIILSRPVQILSILIS